MNETLSSTALEGSRQKPEPAEQKAHKRALILLEVSRRCALKQTLDGLLHELVEMTSSELDCDRGTLFLNDPGTSELYSRVAQGNLTHEIRILNSTGFAGHAFNTGESIITADPYSDERFNPSVDERTGYRTKSMVCVPVRTLAGETIGVMQCLNKRNGAFTADDLDLLSDMTSQAAIALQSHQYVEQIEKIRIKETRLPRTGLRDQLRIRPVGDPRPGREGNDQACSTPSGRPSSCTTPRPEPCSRGCRSGSEISEIRFPSHLGIAGAVFTSGESINIPYAYADLRFNPAFDKQTGFFTRSILCVPIVNKDGKVIGVTQVLNKRGGIFTDEDEQRLKAFTAQIAIALENAKLFDDVRRMKNYNESDAAEHVERRHHPRSAGDTIVTCNAAGGRIWSCAPDSPGRRGARGVHRRGQQVAGRARSTRCVSTRGQRNLPDVALTLAGAEKSVNLTIMPLSDRRRPADIGSMLMFEDISTEKRMKSTMSRYMDPVHRRPAARRQAATEMLGGQSTEATVLFSDIRGFTTDHRGVRRAGHGGVPQRVFHPDGRLHQPAKAACSTSSSATRSWPASACRSPHEDDADRAVRAAIAMMRALWDWNVERRADGPRPSTWASASTPTRSCRATSARRSGWTTP